jgi:hypothetical protein
LLAESTNVLRDFPFSGALPSDFGEEPYHVTCINSTLLKLAHVNNLKREINSTSQEVEVEPIQT